MNSSPPRIAIVGVTGSGKSTVARRVSQELGIRHVEVDSYLWAPGWKKTPKDEMIAAVDAATAEGGWVADGNTGLVRDIIWRRADTLLWFDLPYPLVFVRLLRRSIERALSGRTFLNGNTETLRDVFLSRNSILLFQYRSRGPLRDTIAAEIQKPEYAHLEVHRMRTRAEVEQVVADLCLQRRDQR